MTDLFDITNLITTVGVDGVKIKQEPGVPEKSSNEILIELFSNFDTPDDGVPSPLNSDQQVPNGNVDKPAESDACQPKKKKVKKKHKHKEKKHKKKSKHDSSDNDSDAEDVKKKKKHKKKSKRRHDSVSSRSPDFSHSKAKIAKLDDDNDIGSKCDEAKSYLDSLMEKKASTSEETKLDDQYKEKESDAPDKLDNSGSPRLPPISKKADDEFDEPVIPKLLEKPKQSAQGKILIKDLKNSIVYNETVKEIENKQKAKAAKMEDGELSDSSSNDNRTPTLSPTPPRNRSSSLSPSRDRARSKMFSPTRGSVPPKTDLRLVLKERGKKRSLRDKDSRSQDRRSKSRTRYSSHSNRIDRRERQRGRSRERRDRHRNSERRESDRSRDRHRYRSHSENKDKYARGRSASRERKERIEINKKKLLEIARRNVISMIKQGTLSVAQQDKAIAAIQSGGKTVDELTDFCKSLSKSEALGDLSSISSGDDEESESEKGFHHPFLLKERPSSIIMNIKDAKQLPTKTFQEKTAETSNQLRLQFPVSSGQHHRRTENEWVPVTPKKPEPKKIFVPASTNLCTTPAPAAIMPPPVPSPVPPPVQPPIQPAQTVFPTTTEVVDIGSIVSERLAAIRKLRENPNDVSALNAMYRAQNEMKTWAESKQIPGQFTGSTGVKVLTPAELSSGYQAWARKDQLVSAQPVTGGMGMALLQKMGWRPGEGLGKNKEGALEPLQLEVKLDKRGLVSEQDIMQKVGKTAKPTVPTIKTLEGKHPVSLLGEYCTKKKLGAPVYELCFESGPDHRKNFLFKVKVNGTEYKPSVASSNKKQAKAEAAQICLQTLGLLPS